MDVEILASGSSGNALVLNKVFLLDCGIGIKKINPYLKQLKLVFISHIHG